jgi:hypothetical protein
MSKTRKKKRITKSIGSNGSAPLTLGRPSVATESVEVWPKGHPCEGFAKWSNEGAISIVSDAPIGPPCRHDAPNEVRKSLPHNSRC